jgi:DNA-binding response OmpR family regulator
MTVVMKADTQPGSGVFTVVVVEDTPDLADSIVEGMRREGFDAHSAGDAETGLDLVWQLSPDLVLLDVSLPGMDGLEACRRLREFSDAYVIMLTGHGSELDRLSGLGAGADDYMTKPFYPRELVARIGAMRRRPRVTVAAQKPRRFGEMSIDLDTQKVTVGEEEVQLSRIEYRLLSALSASANHTVSREELLRQVWGEGWVGDDHLVDVHISNLRRKLGDVTDNPRYIKTVRGRGFAMGQG